MVNEKVIKILAEFKDIDPATITDETTFKELEFDSLDMVEVLMSFEDEFNMTLEMSEELKTIGDVVTLLESKME